MKMEIVWNNISVLSITRIKGLYLTNINNENLIKAIEEGMPVSTISSLKIISKKLPYFVDERVPQKTIRDKVLDVVSNDEGNNILRYIQITKCKCATDKFEIHLT